MLDKKLKRKSKRVEPQSSNPVLHPTHAQFADMLTVWAQEHLSLVQAEIFLAQVLPEVRIIAHWLEYETELPFRHELVAPMKRLHKKSSRLIEKIKSNPDYQLTATDSKTITGLLSQLDQVGGYKDESGLSRVGLNSAILDQIQRNEIQEPVQELTASSFTPEAMAPEQQRQLIRCGFAVSSHSVNYSGMAPLFVRRGARSNVIRGVLLEALLQAYEGATDRNARRNDTYLSTLIPHALHLLYEQVNNAPVRFSYSNHIDSKPARAKASDLLGHVKYLVKLEREANFQVSVSDAVLILRLMLKDMDRQQKLEQNGPQYPDPLMPNELTELMGPVFQEVARFELSDALKNADN